MKRTTSNAINRYISDNYVQKDAIGEYIPYVVAETLVDELAAKYTDIYCGVFPDKSEGKLFMVRSSKTSKVFFKVRVK